MLRNMVTGGTLFSELGFYYIGPIDGHDVENLVQIFENVKKSNHQGPVLIHVRTQKEKDTNQQRTRVISIMVFKIQYFDRRTVEIKIKYSVLYKSFCRNFD